MIIRNFIMSAGSSAFYCILLVLALKAKLHGGHAIDAPPQGVAYDDCGDKEKREVNVGKASAIPHIKLDCSSLYTVNMDGPQKYEIGKGGGKIVLKELYVPPSDSVFLKNLKCPVGNCTIVKLDNEAVPPLTFTSLPRFTIQSKNRKSEAIVKFTCTRNSDKRGMCPVAKGAGVCRDSCSNDRDCPGTLKCCSNGCGHACTAPEEFKLGSACETDEQCAVNANCAEEKQSKVCKCKDNFISSASAPEQCVPSTSRAIISVTLSQPWNPNYLDTSSTDYIVLKDEILYDIKQDEAFISIEELEFSENNGLIKVSYILTAKSVEEKSGVKEKSTWTSPMTKEKTQKRDVMYHLKNMVRASMKNNGIKYESIDAHLVGKLGQFCYNKNDCVLINARCFSKGCACAKEISDDLTTCLQ